MSTVQTVSADVTLPIAAGGAVNVTVPALAKGPITLTLVDSARSLRYRLREVAGVAFAPLPTIIEGPQQIVIFEEAEKIGAVHGYEVWQDGLVPVVAVLDYRTDT